METLKLEVAGNVIVKDGRLYLRTKSGTSRLSLFRRMQRLRHALVRPDYPGHYAQDTVIAFGPLRITVEVIT